MGQINKLFGIGFQKTATTSLGEALSILGYKVTGPFGWMDADIQRTALSRALSTAEKFDAFQDFPWAILYKELDMHFPNSKFILTVRNEEEWYESMLRHFGTRSTPMREWVYGKAYPRWNKKTYIKRYNDHNDEVKDYFKSRPNDLLVVDITAGDGWKPICSFLDCKEPDVMFPRSNPAGERRIQRVSRFARKPLSSFLNALSSYNMTIKKLLKLD